MKAVRQEEIYQAFLRMYHKLRDNRALVLKSMLDQLRELQDKCHIADSEQFEINRQITELIQQNHSLARLQTKGCIDSAIFIERCNRNNREIERLRFERNKSRESDILDNMISNTELLWDILEIGKPMLEFEAGIFRGMIEKITAYPKELCFHLRNGLILREGRESR